MVNEVGGMNTAEIVRLIDWMTAEGISAEKIMECIKYIAAAPSPTED